VTTISIYGGTIVGGAENGAGIGAGDANSGNSIIEIIGIYGGYVEGVGVNGAGIGAGGAQNGESSVSFVHIINATITCTSGGGAGIGSGEAGEGNTFVDIVKIENCDVVAESLDGGSAIGGGHVTSSGMSTVEDLTILGSRISVTSDFAYGIGDEIGLAISFGGDVDLAITCHSTQGGINGSSIVISDANLKVQTIGNQVFVTAPVLRGAVDMTMLYDTVSTEQIELVEGLPAIEIGNLSLPTSSLWDLTAAGKTVAIDASHVNKVFITLPGPGTYAITAQCEGTTGYLTASDGRSAFEVGRSPLFVDNAFVVAGIPGPSASPAASLPASPVASLPASPVVSQTQSPNTSPDKG
jgi:hypothetical protein